MSFKNFFIKIFRLIGKGIISFLTNGLINGTVGKLLGTLLFDFTVIVGGIGFIWTFYCAVGERVFRTGLEENISTTAIIDSLAFSRAVRDVDLLIICFPFIFLCISLLVHYVLEDLKISEVKEQAVEKSEWWQVILRAIFNKIVGIIALMVILDVLAASISLRTFHDHHTLGGWTEDYEWSNWYVMHVGLMVCCGILSSILIGFLISYVRKIISRKNLVKMPLHNQEDFENENDIEYDD